ncbi:MAG: hypothetical protein NZ700_08330 [Gemmataceae bacterium]|nr:hypothetical protein [Gemmataceae bacterium]MDW8264987.1 hypothetical protein [Gemmataceae bacterium]
MVAPQLPSPDVPDVPTRRVALGLFVIGQLVFLVTANLLRWVDSLRPRLKEKEWVKVIAPDWVAETGHVYDAMHVVSGLTRRWSQLTGQPQNWSLFAPVVADHVPFPAVELRWTAEAPPRSVWVLSDNEPEDVRAFFRIGKFRLRRYESVLSLGLWRGEHQLDEVADGWRQRIERLVRQEGAAIQAYCRWRGEEYRRRHAERPPPTEYVLWMRVYHTPPPDDLPDPWLWRGPEVWPVARWRPAEKPPAGHGAVEMYHPVARRFEYLR